MQAHRLAGDCNEDGIMSGVCNGGLHAWNNVVIRAEWRDCVTLRPWYLVSHHPHSLHFYALVWIRYWEFSPKTLFSNQKHWKFIHFVCGNKQYQVPANNNSSVTYHKLNWVQCHSWIGHSSEQQYVWCLRSVW